MTSEHDHEALGDHARDGMAHLQQAAKELIRAGRSLLDAAEDLVEDPAAMTQLGDALGTLAKLAGTALGGVAHRDSPDAAPTADEPRVQRIRVS